MLFIKATITIEIDDFAGLDDDVLEDMGNSMTDSLEAGYEAAKNQILEYHAQVANRLTFKFDA